MKFEQALRELRLGNTIKSTYSGWTYIRQADNARIYKIRIQDENAELIPVIQMSMTEIMGEWVMNTGEYMKLLSQSYGAGTCESSTDSSDESNSYSFCLETLTELSKKLWSNIESDLADYRDAFVPNFKLIIGGKA